MENRQSKIGHLPKLLMLSLFAWPCFAQAPAYVGGTYAESGSAVNQLCATYSISGANHAIAVAGGISGTPTALNVTDGKTLTWTNIKVLTNTNNGDTAFLFGALNGANTGSDSICINWTGTGGRNAWIAPVEYSGTHLTTPFDTSGVGFAFNPNVPLSTSDGTALTINFPSETILVVGNVASSGSNTGAGTGFTLRQGAGASLRGSSLSDETSPGTGTQTATVANPLGVQGEIIAVGIRSPASAAPVRHRSRMY